MRWEELTADEFAEAVVDCGRTCVVPMGVLERHGSHMPLGTDMMDSHYVATLAAQREPAVVFPPWFLGEIYEALCFPGTITLRPTLLVELMLNIFDEIGRNGFKKIIIYNGHGGNSPLVNYLCQCQLAGEKPYQVYSLFWHAGLTEDQRAKWDDTLDAPIDRHAGESETSVMMAHRPDLVKMDAHRAEGFEDLGRLSHFGAGRAPLSWYASFPEHHAGDARKASAEKGKVLAGLLADSLAAFIRTVKNDTVAPGLAEEFFRRERQIRGEK